MGELSGKGLEAALKEKNKEYYDNYCKIKERAELDFASSSNQKGVSPTSHGLTHIERVKKKLYELMGETAINKLNSVELYTLLCAITLHDIGMAWTGLCEEHSEESAKAVEKDNGDNWIDEDIKDIVVDIIRAHGKEDLEEFLNSKKEYLNGRLENVKGESVKVGVLMALLRMGDILDWAFDRASESLREETPIVGESFYHWYKHGTIEKIEPNRQRKTIRITGRNYGKYNCRVLKHEKEILDKELEHNKKRLREIDLEYEKFEFSTYTEKEINKHLKKDTAKNLFRPFISYGEEDYIKFQGRDIEEDELIKRILKARAQQSVVLLTADSGDGKTSLLKARIVPDFIEMGFTTKYFDDVTDAQNYLDKEFGNEEVKDKQQTTRYLIIIDQIERGISDANGDDKSKNLESLLKSVNRLVKEDKEEELKERVVHFVFSVSGLSVSQLGQTLSEEKIGTLTYFLRKINIEEVVKQILKYGSINYEETVIEEITASLLKTNNADITNVHILFQSLLENNKRFLNDRRSIIDEFGSVDKMVETLMKKYFDKKFSELTDEEKGLLKRACNYKGTGTCRVSVEDREKKRLQTLKDKGFIRLYEKEQSNEYEFVHDILARKFHDDVLNEQDKAIDKLIEKIANPPLAEVTLGDICDHKEDIARRELEDALIANLLSAYMMDKGFSREIRYWGQKYKSPDVIIEKLIQNIDNRISQSKKEYEHMLSVLKEMHTLLNCAKKRDPAHYKKMVDKVKEISRNTDLYVSRCIASRILEKEKIEELDKENNIEISFRKTYDKILVEPAYEELYKEIYCYLQHHRVLRDLTDKNKMSKTHFQYIRDMLLKFNVKSKFYIYEYEEKIKPVELEEVVSLITSKITEEVPYSDAERPMKLRIEKISFDSKKICYKYNEKSFEIDTKLEKETLMKFANQNEVNILIQENGKERPIAFLKKEMGDSHRIFTKMDIVRSIRQYKIDFANEYKKGEYERKVLNDFLENNWEKAPWTIIKGVLAESNDIEKFCSKNFNKNFPEEISGTKLQSLYVALYSLNYANLQMAPKYRIRNAKIILLQKENELKGTSLYDQYYIKLEVGDGHNSVKDVKIDPWSISGVGLSGKNIIEWNLIEREEEIKIEKHEVKNEVEFFENVSPAIAIGIGKDAGDKLDKYKDCFSFKVMWDDKVNRVSQAIDAWEYELFKVLTVVEKNGFIRDLFVCGDIMKCRKTVGILKKYCSCQENLDMPEKWKGLDEEVDLETSYFSHLNVESLGKVSLNIIHFDTDSSDSKLEERISYFILESYIRINNMKIIDSQKDLDEKIKAECEAKCKAYLESIGNFNVTKANTVQVDNINDAYRAMLAALLCCGNKNIDSSGKEILDIHGFSLTITDVFQNGYKLFCRRKEIEEYYQTQWDDDEGEIKKIADSTDVFNCNQVERVKEKLTEDVKRKNKLGNRKLMITFYAPKDEKVSKFDNPSLLNCFLLPRYVDEQCILDVIFTWRTNECVLGLPLSLETSIRWIDEKIISPLKRQNNIRIGNYTYFGGSMHCADNFIMRQMIANVIPEVKKKEQE